MLETKILYTGKLQTQKHYITNRYMQTVYKNKYMEQIYAIQWLVKNQQAFHELINKFNNKVRHGSSVLGLIRV